MFDALTRGFEMLANLPEGGLPPKTLSLAVGYLCYLLLSLSVALGLLVHTRWFSKSVTAVLDEIHQWSGAWTVYTCLVHALLLANGGEGLSWAQALLPSFSGRYGWSLAVGIYALYAFLAVTIGGYLAGVIKGYLWRWIHWLAFPAWLFALLHVLFISHHGKLDWAVVMYVVTGVVVVGLTAARFLINRPAAKRAVTPAQSPS